MKVIKIIKKAFEPGSIRLDKFILYILVPYLIISSLIFIFVKTRPAGFVLMCLLTLAALFMIGLLSED